LRTFVFSHLIVSAVAVGLTYLLAGQNGLSVACGTATSLLNIVTLGFTWRLLLAKKLVALMILIIVFKFALLVWILYAAARSEYIHLGWFGLGLGMIIPSSLVTSFWVSRNSRSREKR